MLRDAEPPPIEQGNGIHAAKLANEILTLFQVEGKNDFGIGFRLKAISFSSLSARSFPVFAWKLRRSRR